MSKEFGHQGQATTEMAILGTILMVAFATMLRWGQVMNKQQEISMLSFRKTLDKAYSSYAGGDYGGASYRMVKYTRVVEPFNKYYTGRQSQQVGAGNSVFWDPDIFYADSGDAPKTYYNAQGVEEDLGENPEIWDVVTNTITYINDLELVRSMNQQNHQDYVKVNVQDDYTFTIKTEDDGDIPISANKDYSKDERWTTPWR